MKRFYIIIVVLSFHCISFGQFKVSISHYKRVLKKYAINYTPKNEINQPPDTLPIPSKEVRGSIILLDSKNKNFVKLYTCLIILKIYYAHLQCCNQSYELRKYPKNDTTNNIILYYCLKNTGFYDYNENPEFIPSSFVYDRIKEKKLFSGSKIITKEVKFIDELLSEIEK